MERLVFLELGEQQRSVGSLRSGELICFLSFVLEVIMKMEGLFSMFGLEFLFIFEVLWVRDQGISLVNYFFKFFDYIFQVIQN